jgi:hypothetical protein
MRILQKMQGAGASRGAAKQVLNACFAGGHGPVVGVDPLIETQGFTS